MKSTDESSFGTKDKSRDSVQDEKIGMATIEEARMVLPGIQALFGFQLIAAFNQRFQELSSGQQVLHYVALVLIAIAIAVIMTPAAYHRLVERGSISKFFVSLASSLIAIAMFPLMSALCIEVYLLGWIIVHQQVVSIVVSLGLLIVFASLWYAFPFAMRWKQRSRSEDR